eukprot:CAMPEP_0114539088 /NCGR_PEP_ID=MMETSP0114-20121206/52_1 /TAXON_ID=31324 /ORGANISM="Goniomonas sp, Strain m" /LENGTH=78 /DNA_ID=CAMNT_0001723169 /DNA_START=35 /DNA_END=271 /DNA_ORIENTATION=-
MENNAGQKVDLYVPRKCSYTNRLIEAQDNGSVQINVGHVNAEGVYTGQYSAFALCGFIRAEGKGDQAFADLWTAKCRA